MDDQASVPWKDWNAKSYDEHATPQYNASLSHLARLNLERPELDTIVEVGGNTGKVAAALAERYPDKTVVSIDPQESCIAFGRKEYPLKNLRFIQDTAQEYDLETHRIPPAQLAFCYHVLHWIPHSQLPTAFSNIIRNLAPDGTLDIVTSAQGENLLAQAVLKTILRPTWYKAWPRCIKNIIKHVWNGNGSNNTLLRTSELNDLATNHGLIVERCKEVESSVSFESKLQFCSWLKCMLQPHDIKNIVGEDREDEFVASVCATYCQTYNTATDGTILHTIRELHLTGVKPW
jgi:trans-aconitate methyltransferase